MRLKRQQGVRLLRGEMCEIVGCKSVLAADDGSGVEKGVWCERRRTIEFAGL